MGSHIISLNHKNRIIWTSGQNALIVLKCNYIFIFGGVYSHMAFWWLFDKLLALYVANRHFVRCRFVFFFVSLTIVWRALWNAFQACAYCECAVLGGVHVTNTSNSDSRYHRQDVIQWWMNTMANDSIELKINDEVPFDVFLLLSINREYLTKSLMPLCSSYEQ